MPRKNIRPIAGRQFGLLEIKLRQLLACRQIDQVLLSTNDPDIIRYAKTVNDERLVIRERDDALAASSTSTDQLIEYAGGQIPDGDILWTHVTSPFLNAEAYDQMIEEYLRRREEGYDSLMSVTEIRGFLWDKNGPVNYDRGIEKWPRTQTLEPLYEVNSAVFLAPSEVYRSSGDRIGERPFKYVLDKIQGFDIDWEDDFLIAEAMLAAGVGQT
ncbi:cytidylyltransferase domain-containing protein [Marinobacter sp. AN1]|uniref:acylneuraminate cytidylyltransferase family protein n=1 Tax=Marinobacter sp. AN1 TaxID=2886046 RepID=UPI002230B448|nr:acylneuraminate cytidylyltransferase family protein [Marinobacter sp. AN1]UZD66646.1 acylneuraminate cytidylyltransferase family protein [Marinobacter sp. AN1]